jgi:hypothetical protein
MGQSACSAIIFGVSLDAAQSTAIHDEIRKQYIALHPGMTTDDFDTNLAGDGDVSETLEMTFLIPEIIPQFSVWPPTMRCNGDAYEAGCDYSAGETHLFGIAISDFGDNAAKQVIAAHQAMPAVTAAFQLLAPFFQNAGVPMGVPDFHDLEYLC